MMNRVLDWLDNPILIKHVRSRMRTGQFIPSAAVVLILCLLICWGGWMLDGYSRGGTFGTLLALQTIVLVVMGASQASSSLSAARESGIIDFHRVSPLSPLELTLGFFFGAPIREYFLFACTLPFSLFCVAMGAPEFSGLVQILIALILGAWVFHSLALLNALTLKRPKVAARGMVGVLVFVFLFSGAMAQGFSMATALLSESPTLSFYGFALPWLVFVIIYVIPTLTFLLMAATRKMRSDRAHIFSKPQSVACLTALTVLMLGALWDVHGLEYGALVVLYVLVATAMALTLTITPTAWEYAKALRRAEKMGRERPHFWENLALNRTTLAIFCGIVLFGSTTAWRMIEGKPSATGSTSAVSYSVAISIAVFTVAYFGLALQFFYLFFSKRVGAFAIMGLFLFVVWLVPLLVGVILAAAGMREAAGTFVIALSPLAGIAMSVGVGERAFGQLAQLAALMPAIGFAFLFNNLVVFARRRLERAVHGGSEVKSLPQTHPLAVT